MKMQGALIIFAKAPVEGQVKTRLIPEIGQRKATNLYKQLLTKTLNTALKIDISERHIWISGNLKHEYFYSLKWKGNFKLHKQTGNNLGERMFNAFNSILEHCSCAVLIGSDCFELSSSDIESAMMLLENGKDLVLGPAIDGGYYLIGLRKNNSRLFSNIEWGTDKVFSETVSRARELKLEIGLLSEKNDIDRVCDLQAYTTELVL